MKKLTTGPNTSTRELIKTMQNHFNQLNNERAQSPAPSERDLG
jgi:hypothetical protein